MSNHQRKSVDASIESGSVPGCEGCRKYQIEIKNIKEAWRKHCKEEVEKHSKEEVEKHCKILKEKHEDEKKELLRKIEEIQKNFEAKAKQEFVTNQKLEDERKNNTGLARSCDRAQALIQRNISYKDEAEKLIWEFHDELIVHSKKSKANQMCQTDSSAFHSKTTQTEPEVHTVDMFSIKITELSEKKKQLDTAIQRVLKRKADTAVSSTTFYANEESTNSPKRSKIDSGSMASPPSIIYDDEENNTIEKCCSGTSSDSEVQFLEEKVSLEIKPDIGQVRARPSREQINEMEEANFSGNVINEQSKHRHLSGKENENGTDEGERDVAGLSLQEFLHRHSKSSTQKDDENVVDEHDIDIHSFEAYLHEWGNNADSSPERLATDYLNFVPQHFDIATMDMNIYKERLIRHVEIWKNNNKESADQSSDINSSK